jgi:hypothetical protein
LFAADGLAEGRPCAALGFAFVGALVGALAKGIRRLSAS